MQTSVHHAGSCEADCNGRGLCNRTTTECLCFEPYFGDGCRKGKQASLRYSSLRCRWPAGSTALARECHTDPRLPFVLRTVRQRIPALLALWCSALLEQLHRQRARCVQLRQWCAPRVPRDARLCPHRAAQMRLGSRAGCQPHLRGMHNKQMGLAPHLRGVPIRRRTSCSACRRVLVSRDRDRCIYRIGLWHAR
jgi:hypothetical protein